MFMYTFLLSEFTRLSKFELERELSIDQINQINHGRPMCWQNNSSMPFNCRQKMAENLKKYCYCNSYGDIIKDCEYSETSS